jgi:polyisoprenoid-binding protein YceI
MVVQTERGAAGADRGLKVPAPGVYMLDRAHTMIEFSARQLMVSRVRGRFTEFVGGIEIKEDVERSYASATIHAASIRSGDEERDAHLRSKDFLNAEAHPTIEYHSTELKPIGKDRWQVTGDLTICGRTRQVVLKVTFEGTFMDPWGSERLVLSATGTLDREDWGLTWNKVLDTGGWLVSKEVGIELSVTAIRLELDADGGLSTEG